MKLLIDGKRIEQSFESLLDLDTYWKEINKKWRSEKTVVEYIEVNGEKFYSNIEKVIVDNFERIQSLNIYTISEVNLLKETISELSQYTEKMLSESGNIGDLFYGEMDEDKWNKFFSFSQGLEWMFQALNSITFLMDNNNFQRDHIIRVQNVEKQFEEKVTLLAEAIQSQDITSVGDIVNFEFLPIFEEITDMFKDI